MAEAIVNSQLGNRWLAFSAGTKPTGYVHPKTITVLEEIGIQHEGESKTADEYRGVEFDLIVTVCDDAAQNCPTWLGKGSRIHLGFPDPAKAEGTESEILQIFRTVRDDMQVKIHEILTQ
jgi:arsenate reductase